MKCEVGWRNVALAVALLAGAGLAQGQQTQSLEGQEGPPPDEGPPPAQVMVHGGMAGEAGPFFEDHI